MNSDIKEFIQECDNTTTEVYFFIRKVDDKFGIYDIADNGMCFTNGNFGQEWFDSYNEAYQHITQIMKPVYTEHLTHYKLIQVEENDERYLKGIADNEYMASLFPLEEEYSLYTKFCHWKEDKKRAIRKWLLNLYLKITNQTMAEFKINQ